MLLRMLMVNHHHSTSLVPLIPPASSQAVRLQDFQLRMNFLFARYGIVSGARNSITAVIRAAALSSSFRTARLAPRRYSRRHAQSGSFAAHLDQPPACAAAARPERRCSYRRYPREHGSLATGAPARELAEVPREMRATRRTHLCSARPGPR